MIAACWRMGTIERINRLPLKTRRILRSAFSRIVAFPDGASDFQEQNARGIPLEVHLCGGFALKYWIGFP